MLKKKLIKKSERLESFLGAADFFFAESKSISWHRKRPEIIPVSGIRVIFGAPSPVKADPQKIVDFITAKSWASHKMSQVNFVGSPRFHCYKIHYFLRIRFQWFRSPNINREREIGITSSLFLWSEWYGSTPCEKKTGSPKNDSKIFDFLINFIFNVLQQNWVDLMFGPRCTSLSDPRSSAKS